MAISTNTHADVLQAIEGSLVEHYDNNPNLRDTTCICALDSAKIAIKKQFGYAKNESISNTPELKDIIDSCVAIGLEHINGNHALPLKEYVACLEKVKKSVLLHSQDGQRGYFNFMNQFF